MLPGLIVLQPALAKSDSLRIAGLKAEEVRRLKEAGDIMPLEALLRDIQRDYPGRIIEIELDEEDGSYVYELEIVNDEGIVWEYHFDARNGELLERERED